MIGSRLHSWTRNECSWNSSPLYVLGELQISKLAPSSEHSNTASASGPLHSKVAERDSVRASGWTVIVTGSGTSPTAHSHSAGVRSTLPSGALARTKNSCSSRIRLLYVTGDVHGS